MIAPTDNTGSADKADGGLVMSEEEHEALLASVQPPPCPPWCQDGTQGVGDGGGHRGEYAGVDPEGALVQYHSMEVNTTADIAQLERYVVGEGSTCSEPYISAFISDGEPLDATKARQYAADLTAAADKLDEITDTD